MGVITLVYSYLCLVSFLIGSYVGFRGFPPPVEDYQSPILLSLMIMNTPLPILILWLQKSYAFKATELLIGCAGFIFICGFLFGSWLHIHINKAHNPAFDEYSRFNRSRMKISVAMIAGVWGAIIGSAFPIISVKVLLKDNYVSTISILGVLTGWVISGPALKFLDYLVGGASGKGTHGYSLHIINVVTILGLIHLATLLFLNHQRFPLEQPKRMLLMSS